MSSSLFRAFKMVLWLTFLTGVAYPLFITGISYLIMPGRAQGSLLVSNGKVIGSRLIAQKFTSERYFWPRPSAIDFNPLPSGGSNLGPTSRALQNLVKDRRKHLTETHSINEKNSIPSELLYASGSGLDPHITINAVNYQLERVAEARKLDEKGKLLLRNIISQHMLTPGFGILGESYVNVLELNYAMDLERR